MGGGRLAGQVSAIELEAGKTDECDGETGHGAKKAALNTRQFAEEVKTRMKMGETRENKFRNSGPRTAN